MPSGFLVGRFADGSVVRLVGHGTLMESPAFAAAVEAVFDKGTVVFDASGCTYLDSTFLGCLVGIFKSCLQVSKRRFVIAAPPDVRRRLFSTSSLDTYFDFSDACPEILGDMEEIATAKPERAVLGLHIMRCHDRLATFGGSKAADFKAVADGLAKELRGIAE
jgi:anti-anti-sigma regulatory factor